MLFETIPQKLVYGGEALGHHAGRAVFVPRVLPGERVEVEVVRIAKGVVHARPLRVLDPSPDRIAPPCPYFGQCGGCHYQHFEPRLQAETKREILRETLRRTGGIDWQLPIQVHSAQPHGYRNQAQFKVGRDAGGRLEIGFFEADSHRLCRVDECLLLSRRINQVLEELRGDRWQSLLEGCTEIDLFADERDENMTAVFRGSRANFATLPQEILSSIPAVRCVGLEEEGGLRVWGEPHLVYSVGEYRYQVSPGSFFQISRFLLPALVDAVLGTTQGTTALDLYGGVGLFTLPLARRFESVTAVEASEVAATDLRENARIHDLGNVITVTATAHDFLRCFAQTDVDLVILDPPRAGMGGASLKLLAGLRPKRIHYVSCSPPTLARDLRYLVAHGYDLDSVEMFDFFPHTYHLESLVRLVCRAA